MFKSSPKKSETRPPIRMTTKKLRINFVLKERLRNFRKNLRNRVVLRVIRNYDNQIIDQLTIISLRADLLHLEMKAGYIRLVLN